MPETISFAPYATADTIARRILNMATSDFTRYKLRDVEHVQVSLVTHPSRSGQSSSFVMVMTGNDLNGDESDTRRIFTITVKEENTNHG